MALLWQYMDNINRYLNRYEDKRTANWFLMSSPFYTLAICLTYVYIVKVSVPYRYQEPASIYKYTFAYVWFM